MIFQGLGYMDFREVVYHMFISKTTYRLTEEPS